MVRINFIILERDVPDLFCRSSPRSEEWAGPDYTRTQDGGYPDGVQGDYVRADGRVGHGTMMLSDIAGRGVGAVKNPSMVIVRTQENYGPVPALQKIEYVL